MDRIRSYFSHAISYAVSGLTVVAGLNPALLPPRAGMVVGVAGLVLTALHNVQVASKTNSVPPVAKVLAMFALSVMLASSLMGCSLLKSENTVLHQVAVQYATGKYIESAKDPVARATKVLEVTDTIQSFASSDSVTLDVLSERALGIVTASDLSAADKVLASTLVAAVVTELRTRVGTGALSADDLYTVNSVLAWVEQAAQIYVPHTS